MTAEPQLGPRAQRSLDQVLGAQKSERQALDRARMWRSLTNRRVAQALGDGVPATLLAQRLGVSVQRVYQMRAEAASD